MTILAHSKTFAQHTRFSLNNVIQTTATKRPNSAVTDENVQSVHCQLQRKPSVNFENSIQSLLLCGIGQILSELTSKLFSISIVYKIYVTVEVIKS